MIAVIFEVEPAERDVYLRVAEELRPRLNGIDGFVSIERFQSLGNPDRMLSLSYWRDESAVMSWRKLEAHRSAQAMGRSGVFRNYRLRVAQIVRQYGLQDRDEAPSDSRWRHG